MKTDTYRRSTVAEAYQLAEILHRDDSRVWKITVERLDNGSAEVTVVSQRAAFDV